MENTISNSKKISKILKIVKRNSSAMPMSVERKDYGVVRLEGAEAEKYSDLEVGSFVEMTVKAKVTEQSIREWDNNKRCTIFNIESVEIEEEEEEED